MKTLDEVYYREDYTHLNGILSERVSEIQEKVAEKMDELELSCLKVTEDVSFQIVKHNDGNRFVALTTKGNKERAFVSSTNRLLDGYPYYNSKFCAYYAEYGYRKLSTKEKLTILNNVRTIVENLDMVEDEKCEVLRKALGMKEGEA